MSGFFSARANSDARDANQRDRSASGYIKRVTLLKALRLSPL